jgi:hypothetical protein
MYNFYSPTVRLVFKAQLDTCETIKFKVARVVDLFRRCPALDVQIDFGIDKLFGLEMVSPEISCPEW